MLVVLDVRVDEVIFGDNQAIAALGHDWQTKQQVPTEYDENGDIITQGYTIYKCQRCGEEYRSDTQADPPAVVDDNTTALVQYKNRFLQ